MAARPRGCRVATERHRHRRHRWHGHGEPGREQPWSDGSGERRAELSRGIFLPHHRIIAQHLEAQALPPNPALFLARFMAGRGCGAAAAQDPMMGGRGRERGRTSPVPAIPGCGGIAGVLLHGWALAAHRCSRLYCPNTSCPVAQWRCWQILGAAKHPPALCHGLPIPSICTKHLPAPPSPPQPLAGTPEPVTRCLGDSGPQYTPPSDGDTTAGHEH